MNFLERKKEDEGMKTFFIKEETKLNKNKEKKQYFNKIES